MPKRILMAALALSLLGGTSAMADPDHHDNKSSGGGGHPSGGPGPSHAQGGGPGGGPGGGHGPVVHNTNPAFGGGGGSGAGNGHAFSGGPGYHHSQGQGGGGSGGVHGQGSASVHYSVRAFPHIVQPQSRFHWHGDWNPPRGFYYRHWGYGDRLPFGWFAAQFWISDYFDYGLAPAPYGYAWVREGPDALLVNVYTGQVVEVEYGLFY